MKTGIAIAAAIFLTGCITTAPQSIGRDTYLIETMGTNMTVRPALKRATDFCDAQHKAVRLLTSDKAGVGPGANTSITFMCLDPSDPRYRER